MPPITLPAKDPNYRFACGWKRDSYWFALVDRQRQIVDANGANGELPHLVDLVEASWAHVAWQEQIAGLYALQEQALEGRSKEAADLVRGLSLGGS